MVSSNIAMSSRYGHEPEKCVVVCGMPSLQTTNSNFSGLKRTGEVCDMVASHHVLETPNLQGIY